MKRYGHLFSQVCSLENLNAAVAKARKGKSMQYGVQVFDRNVEENIYELRDHLLQKEYTTSKYTVFQVHDPKERDVYRLPFYPDRIVHHAIMNILEPVFTSVFTTDTYSCIKGKGIHAAQHAIEYALRDQPGTQYCLKLDIRKFYPSIDHGTLKLLLRRKIKDRDLLWLLDDIIDSAPGVPIGNYLSQYFANYYLAFFDHWIKEIIGVKYYFRYADDIVVLASNKAYLHELRHAIEGYLNEQLHLQLKSNYQIFPVTARGIDVIGYVFYHSHTRLRKAIKQRFARKMKSCPKLESVAAYWGWAKHCNSNHFLKKLLNESTESSQELQRIRDKDRIKGLRRRKYQHQQAGERKNHCARLQNRTVQV